VSQNLGPSRVSITGASRGLINLSPLYCILPPAFPMTVTNQPFSLATAPVWLTLDGGIPRHVGQPSAPTMLEPRSCGSGSFCPGDGVRAPVVPQGWCGEGPPRGKPSPLKQMPLCRVGDNSTRVSASHAPGIERCAEPGKRDPPHGGAPGSVRFRNSCLTKIELDVTPLSA